MITRSGDSDHLIGAKRRLSESWSRLLGHGRAGLYPGSCLKREWPQGLWSLWAARGSRRPRGGGKRVVCVFRGPGRIHRSPGAKTAAQDRRGSTIPTSADRQHPRIPVSCSRSEATVIMPSSCRRVAQWREPLASIRPSARFDGRRESVDHRSSRRSSARRAHRAKLSRGAGW